MSHTTNPYRALISIQASEVSASVTDYSAYYKLSLMPLEFWGFVRTDGGDIRMYASDGVTELPVEIVTIDVVAKTGEIHFKAPSVSGTVDTDFYIEYGDLSLPAPPSINLR